MVQIIAGAKGKGKLNIYSIWRTRLVKEAKGSVVYSG